MDKSVLLTEVGLRDGLQNLKQIISTKDKLHLLNSLIDAGLRRIPVSKALSNPFGLKTRQLNWVFEVLGNFEISFSASAICGINF